MTCVDNVGHPSFEYAECFHAAFAAGFASCHHLLRRLVSARQSERDPVQAGGELARYGFGSTGGVPCWPCSPVQGCIAGMGPGLRESWLCADEGVLAEPAGKGGSSSALVPVARCSGELSSARLVDRRV